MIREIKHFLMHLRLHYQIFILSGGYLLGGFMANQMDAMLYWQQFVNIHVLLYGGATAFNSYWDKDTGPIGGLKSPPKMTPWMHHFSIFLMISGGIWAFSTGVLYGSVYSVSILFFWLYSTPLARWKGHPHLSLIAIGISTGLNSVLLGVLAAGAQLSVLVLLSSAGAALILLSLYPVSQIYQTDEDTRRGDCTFAIRYGITGVKNFFLAAYFSGLLLLCISMFWVYPAAAGILFITGLCSGFILCKLIFGLKGEFSEYSSVMKIKFFASFSFVLFLLIANSLRYGWLSTPIF